MIHKKTVLLAVGALLFALLSVLAGLMSGAAGLTLTELWDAFADTQRATAAGRIVWYVRVPRVAGAMICGAALAVSGAVVQGVLGNPLASPGMIGINAGAGFAVVLCAACGILGGWRLSAAAFLGAFLTALTVSAAAHRFGASDSIVILIGAAVNSLLGACSDTVTTLVPDVSIQSTFFRAGDFSSVTAQSLRVPSVVILCALGLLLFLTNELDVLGLGEETARGLGMHTGRMRVLFLLLAALLAGAAVSTAGLLSFIGLLVPHAVRRLTGGGAGVLLPMCAVLGGAFTVLCDTAARTLFAPYELPVGILLAFLGAPFFLFLLLRGRGGQDHA